MTDRQAATEALLERFGENPAPAICRGQLLRTLRQGPEEAGIPSQGRGRRLPTPVMRGHSQPGPAGMVGLAGHAVQQQRPVGDRLAVALGVGGAREHAPPVLNQRDQSSHVPAARQVARGEAAPAPLILQLLEALQVTLRAERIHAHRCAPRP